jgi:hypothetical protein
MNVLVASLLLTATYSINAQSSSVLKAQKLQEKYLYTEAVKSYLKGIESNSNQQIAFKKLGDLYF